MNKEKISEIAHRSNINYRETYDNEVVIYEDHRTILSVLFYLKQKRNLTEPLNLVMFDNHDDYLDPKTTALKNISKFLKAPTIQKLYQIVEFDLNPRDDDWVKTGMELGLIDNVFLFNSVKSSISYGQREPYKTKKFGTKYLYNVGNVWSALGYHGILNDPSKSQYQQLWNDFNWELVEGRYKFSSNRKKFVFDIDLDCFSTEILDKTIAIPEEVIISRLTEYNADKYHDYYNAQTFMKSLVKDGELVTICFENGCCGGIRQSHKIFNLVDYLLFDSELGK